MVGDPDGAVVEVGTVETELVGGEGGVQRRLDASPNRIAGLYQRAGRRTRSPARPLRQRTRLDGRGQVQAAASSCGCRSAVIAHPPSPPSPAQGAAQRPQRPYQDRERCYRDGRDQAVPEGPGKTAAPCLAGTSAGLSSRPASGRDRMEGWQQAHNLLYEVVGVDLLSSSCNQKVNLQV